MVGVGPVLDILDYHSWTDGPRGVEEMTTIREKAEALVGEINMSAPDPESDVPVGMWDRWCVDKVEKALRSQIEECAKVAEKELPDKNWGEGMPMGGADDDKTYYSTKKNVARRIAAEIRNLGREKASCGIRHVGPCCAETHREATLEDMEDSHDPR